MGKVGGGISDALGIRGITDEFGLTKGPKEPASAKKLEAKAAREAEKKRLSRSRAKQAGGQTKFASANTMGMTTKKTMG